MGRAVMGRGQERAGKIAGAIITAAILLIVAAVFLYGNTRGIHAELAESALHVSGPMFQESVPLGSIAEVSLREDVAYGSRTWGTDFVGLQTGSFQNTAFGAYRCAVYAGTKCCIVVKTAEEGPLVFNLKTDELTRAFFERLQSALQ